MSLQDLWDKLVRWGRRLRRDRFDTYADIDESTGLINQYADEPQGQALLKKADKAQQLDRMQENFTRLVEQLEHIHNHLNQHVSQQREMMEKIAAMPRLMEHFPSAIEHQERMMELLSEQFKASAQKTQEFVETIKKLPEESIRQTDTLISINRQLGVAADADIVMSENFAKFNVTLEKLNQATICQTDSVVQMSKTFAASDRYLKYLVDKQNKRFMWVFIIAMGVSVTAILSLVTIIAFMK